MVRNRVRTPEPLSTHKTCVVGPGGAWATTSSILSTRYRRSRAIAIHWVGKICEFQAVSGSPSVAKCSESSPEETRTVAMRATFGFSGDGAGVGTGVDAVVGATSGMTVDTLVVSGWRLTVGAAGGGTVSDPATQEVKANWIRSRPVNATTVLIGSSTARKDVIAR